MIRLLGALLIAGTSIAYAGVLELDAAVRAACPQIDGVSPDGTIWFQPAATKACQDAAQAVMAYTETYMKKAPIADMQVASTAEPALNGTYAIDPASQQKVQAISLYIAVNGKFPGGQSQQAWKDAAGIVHVFTSTAEWQALATAMADFVAAIDLGQTPSQPVTIP
jgi:hypothetical protein